MMTLDRDGLRYQKRLVRNLALRSAATILEREDGGPMRPVGRRRGIRPGGLYYSQKMGRLIGWESKAERDAFYVPEVSPDIEYYREQPHTATALIDGVKRSYTPDRLDVRADGSYEIVEIKDEFEADADPDYALKLSFFGEIYKALGWDFAVINRADIEKSHDVSALKKIQDHRRALFSNLELDEVSRIIGDQQSTVGELRDLFPHPLEGEAKLCAMMVGRFIRIDTARPFTANTTVKLA